MPKRGRAAVVTAPTGPTSTHRHLDDVARRPDPVHAAADRPAGTGEVHVTEDPLGTEAAPATLLEAHGRIGAIVTFTGIARADPLPDGTKTVALGFEAYPEMATDELERVRQEALRRFAIDGVTIHHRIGTVPVGAPIVVVAASAAHRSAAFEAAAWTMDEVKRRVPLWKQEIGADGRGHWVAGEACRCHGP